MGDSVFQKTGQRNIQGIPLIRSAYELEKILILTSHLQMTDFFM